VTVTLRAVGGFLPLSDTGFILNDTATTFVDPGLAARVNEVYRATYGDDLHSVYVRGSVARGNFLPGVSDLDTFAAVDRDDVAQAMPGAGEASAALLREFPDFTEIVFVAVSVKTILTERRNPFTFLLQTQSCCIYGTPLHARLEPYRPDIEIVGEAMYLRHRIAKYAADVEGIDAPEALKLQCGVLMKGLVRSAYDLVLPIEGRYTRDLFWCYRGFVRHYPEHDAAVRQAVEWALEPIADKGAIGALLSGFGVWLCTEIDKMLGRSVAAEPRRFPLVDGLTVQAASPESLEVRQLLDELSNELLAGYGSSGRASFVDWQHDQPSHIFVVARLNGQAVGCGGVRPIAEGVGEIKRMFVKHRRKAIGSAVLQELEARAAAVGYETLWLETRAANTTAVAFYRAHGYRQRKNFGKYVGNPAAICFEKALRLQRPGRPP
jgi:ribosomal protein S18 acetylase RimI-like enzyme